MNEIQNKTAEIQALIDQAPNGIGDIDLTPYDGCGITSLSIGPDIQSVHVDATRPITLYMLPLLKVVGGLPISMSKGMWNIDHRETTPEFILPHFYSGYNITYDARATLIQDPNVSDDYHDPLGLARTVFQQVAQKEGTIKTFVWLSKVANTCKSALHLNEIEDGYIEIDSRNANRHVIGAQYKQGTAPYNLIIRGTFENVSSPFDLTCPIKTLKRNTTPYANVDVEVENTWWRTKIHGCWSADIQMEAKADGITGYAGLDVANEYIGVVNLHDSTFEDFPAQSISWNHREGSLILDSNAFIRSYTPIYPGNQQITPVVIRGATVYQDCVSVIRPSVGDLHYKVVTDGMTSAQVDQYWLGRMRSAVDTFKANKLTPSWWPGKLFNPAMKTYAVSIGWNGSSWPQ